MSRLVRLAPRGAQFAGAAEKDDFSTRLVKYVPVEVAGPFPIIDNALAQYAQEHRAWVLSLAVFAILFVANVGYLLQKAKKQYPDPAKRRAALWYQLPFSGLAFLIWTYAINSTIWRPHYNPLLATIVSGIFVLLVGLVTPVEPE